MGIALLLGLVGCASSAEPRLYTLVAQSGHGSPAVSSVVEVERPSVAGYLDRREVVRRVLSQRLELAHDAVWAEPLDAMLGRILVQDLALRLPQSRVYGEQSGLAATPEERVQIDVQRFEQVSSNEVLLRALVSVRRAAPNAQPALRQLELRAELPEGGVDGLVAGLNRALAQLADEVAGMLASSALAVAAPARAP
jgi:uncharacterized lipoprotein YmbA